MKFASPGSGRGQTRERQRRQRDASPALRARFPQLGALRLEFAFRDNGPFTPAPQVTTLHPPAPAYFVFPCPSADCDGEFDLGGEVVGMMAEGDKHREGQCLCQGGRTGEAKQRVACGLTLKYSVDAEVA